MCISNISYKYDIDILRVYWPYIQVNHMLYATVVIFFWPDTSEVFLWAMQRRDQGPDLTRCTGVIDPAYCNTYTNRGGPEQILLLSRQKKSTFPGPNMLQQIRRSMVALRSRVGVLKGSVQRKLRWV
jgi:hypothetical protein